MTLAIKPPAPILQSNRQATGLAYFGVCYEGTGTTLHDLSAAADHAVVPSNVWGTGQFSGACLAIGGNTAKVFTLPSSVPFDQAGDFAVSCWVKLASAAQQCFAANISTSGSAYAGWAVGCDDANSGAVKFYTKSGSSSTTTLSATVLTTGAWHHVCCGFAAATGTKSLYIDGALDATSAPGELPPGYLSGRFACLGGLCDADGVTTEQPILGQLDAVAVYSYLVPLGGGPNDNVASIYADPFVAVRVASRRKRRGGDPRRRAAEIANFHLPRPKK